MKTFLFALGLAAAIVAGPAIAAPPADHGGAASVSMQDDASSFLKNPHAHDFYQLTKATFAHGVDGVDEAKYYQDSMAIFRELGRSMGVDPKHMEEHLKLIPGQMAKIVSADPSVLASYDAFCVALVGPP